MVQALVKIDDNSNRVMNVIKAKYDLKDKGQVIDFLVNKYIEDQNEPELRPEFIKRIKQIKKEKGIRFKDVEELRKRIKEA